MLTAIIVAAGSSTRARIDKVFARISGRAVIAHSLDAFSKAESVAEVLLVCREGSMQAMRDLAQDFPKVRGVIRGGERRQDSVQAGLTATSPDTTFVAVHDAARPLIMPREIERVFAVAKKTGAAALAQPVTDTLKLAKDREVMGSVDRDDVFAMQTPQIFACDLLREAYRRIEEEGLTITDEVSAVQSTGGRIALVLAERDNMKITFPGDLALAQTILQQRAAEL